MTALILFGGLPLVIWAYLIAAQGGFWLARERDDRVAAYTIRCRKDGTLLISAGLVQLSRHW